MSYLPESFPNIDKTKDYNPAIRLFGRRFINEQTILECAAEFLGVAFSEKWLNKDLIDNPLPTMQQLRDWPDGVELKYKLPIMLNLKLFALLGASRVDGRHEVHKQQYKKLTEAMKNRMQTNHINKQEAIACIEEFLSGFQGAGFNRAWCAQTFYPVSASLLTQETIWNETVARNQKPLSWSYSIDNFNKYYSSTKRNFMARGGELLYLQLCNIFRIDERKLQLLADRLALSSDEADINQLYRSLQDGLPQLKGISMDSFDCLVNFIEGLDQETSKQTNIQKQFLSCKWCPEESWPEGYLFAVELKRLLSATLDPVERLELFMTGCTLQVLRSLCAQSMRHQGVYAVSQTPLGYAWIFSSSDSAIQQRRISQHNLQSVQGLIQKALREEELKENADRDPKKSRAALYKEADNKYGHKSLLSLGKRLGIIAPYKGPGTRFVMTDRLLRFLVVVLLRPGERVTYQEFLQRMYIHYGIAIEGDQLVDALVWSDLPENSSVQSLRGSWLTDMLRASGFLTDLSDAWSIVRNTFGSKK